MENTTPEKSRLSWKLFTTDDLVKKYKKIWGCKFDYSEVVYTDARGMVKIKCNTCGESFYKQAYNHANGGGCPYCSVRSRAKQLTMPTEEFVKIAKDVHGDAYNYDHTVYKGAFFPVTVYCNTCKSNFTIPARSHIRDARGCPICKDRRVLLGCSGVEPKKVPTPKPKYTNVKTTKDFIQKARKKHGNKYNYDKVNYTHCENKVKIICNWCGNTFKLQAKNHLAGTGCPYCTSIYKTTFAQEFFKRMKELHKDRYNLDKSVYQGRTKPITVYCNVHKKYITTTPHTLLAQYNKKVAKKKQ